MDASDIIRHLTKHRFQLEDEKALQKEIYKLLLPIFPQIKKEFIIDKLNTIDFLIDEIGIEIKIKGGKMEIYKQCERYCKTEVIKKLILMTNRSMGFPPFINGKDCYVINISKAWL